MITALESVLINALIIIAAGIGFMTGFITCLWITRFFRKG